MLESALLSVWILLIIVIQNVLVGGALAAGAWVVWRYLERRSSTRPPSNRADSNRDVVIHWVPLVLVVLAAAWFAFIWPAQQRAMPQPMGSWRLLAPYVVNILIIAGAVWLVRKMIAVGSGRRGGSLRSP
jgi:hypothetical protein